jgi:hypothetical protein
MRKNLVLLLLILCGLNVFSQDSGTNATADTTIQTTILKKPKAQRPKIVHKDSVSTVIDTSVVTDSAMRQDSSTFIPAKENRPDLVLFKRQNDTSFLLINSFFQFTDPMRYSITIKKWQGKEAIFYSIVALLIFFALVKNGFSRYMGDLFKTYFRTAVNQKQAKDQLLQNPMPSVLLNLFFTLSIGMFLALLLQYFKLGLDFNFWWLYLYCVLGLIAIYAIKFVSLKFVGWIFQVSESTDAYAFIVFTTNKIIGIALLPFLVMLAFTYGLVNEAAMSLGIMVVAALIVYRFFLSYISIRRQISISFLHFLLYLFAFEIIPLLLINKLLFSFLGETS